MKLVEIIYSVKKHNDEINPNASGYVTERTYDTLVERGFNIKKKSVRVVERPYHLDQLLHVEKISTTIPRRRNRALLPDFLGVTDIRTHREVKADAEANDRWLRQQRIEKQPSGSSLATMISNNPKL